MADAEALLAVLAGGRGRRLGGSKAMAPLAGRPLIAHVLAAARASALPTIVVAKPGVELPRLACELVFDSEMPQHPLCGVVAALAHAQETGRDRVVAVGCDMPFLSGTLLAWLAGERSGGGPSPRALLAYAGGRPQPLLARYPVARREVLAGALREGRSLSEAALALDPAIVGEGALARFGDPARLSFSVNDHDDLRAAAELLAGASRVPGPGP
jgi:molybdopterin-guanine dinucleotide biosynthesis protein A